MFSAVIRLQSIIVECVAAGIIVLLFLHCLHWALFVTSSAVEAVLLLDPVRFSLFNAELGTGFQAAAAADTDISDLIAFSEGADVSENVVFPENRAHTQIEVFDRSVFYFKDDADFSRISGIDVGEVGLFLKDNIDTFVLFFPRRGNGLR